MPTNPTTRNDIAVELERASQLSWGDGIPVRLIERDGLPVWSKVDDSMVDLTVENSDGLLYHIRSLFVPHGSPNPLTALRSTPAPPVEVGELVERLRADLEAIQYGDRPLPWVVHSGCSYRRIASEPTRENFRSFPDGNVLHAYNQRSDNHPDLSMGERELEALVRLINALPEAADLIVSLYLQNNLYLTTSSEEIAHLQSERDRLREAAQGVLAHRVGDLPIRGDLRDNDASRVALSNLAEVVARSALNVGVGSDE